jgi:hypothetical protein
MKALARRTTSFASLVASALLAAGCIVGGDTETGGGGGGGGGDGGGNGTVDKLVDGGMGTGPETCSGAAYDPCTDNSQCTSGRCHLYAQAGIQVCTTTCTPGDPTTCPQQDGQPAQCNNMGICKPAAANACTR